MLDCIRGMLYPGRRVQYPWRRVHQVSELRSNIQSPPPTTQSPPPTTQSPPPTTQSPPPTTQSPPPTTQSPPPTTQSPNIPIFCPQEIIGLILGHLPPESVAAFALTCRRFYPHLCSEPLNEEARLLLLGWIEKDISHLYLCYECKDLHTWSQVRRRSIRTPSYDKYCRKRNAYSDKLLHFSDGRLVMNRHRYGDLHGPPLQDFNYTTLTPDNEEKAMKQEQCGSLRIIGDELYFKVTTQLYHDQGRARILRERIDDIWFHGADELICRHVAPTERSSVGHTYRARELDRPLGSSALFVPIAGPLRSCPRCFTDFCIDVEWRPLTNQTTKGWIITVTRWQQLGEFRSPEDVKWYNYNERHPKLWRDKVSAAGMVYSNWSAQDDKSAEHMAEDDIVQRENAGFAMWK